MARGKTDDEMTEEEKTGVAYETCLLELLRRMDFEDFDDLNQEFIEWKKKGKLSNLSASRNSRSSAAPPSQDASERDSSSGKSHAINRTAGSATLDARLTLSHDIGCRTASRSSSVGEQRSPSDRPVTRPSTRRSTRLSTRKHSSGRWTRERSRKQLKVAPSSRVLRSGSKKQILQHGLG